MCSREAEQILASAESLGLTGAQYVWVLSNSAVDVSSSDNRRPPKEFPVGLLGEPSPGMCSEFVSMGEGGYYATLPVLK